MHLCARRPPPHHTQTQTHNNHTLQAALDSMYRGSRDVDVRAGLLRLVLHVLHNYGEELISGWAPLIR